MKQFFEKLWGKDEGWIYVATKDHNNGDWWQKQYYYPTELTKAVNKLTEENKTKSVYFCPHMFKDEGKRVKENSRPTDVLWVDKDRGSLSELEPRPTFCWQTSDGKWQAIWRMPEPLDVDKIETLNKKLIKQVRGDNSGWDIGQMLRVPGTINHKYKPAYHGITMWDDGTVRPPEEIITLETVPEDKYEEAARELANIPPIPRNVPSFEDAIVAQGRRIPAVAWELLQSTPKTNKNWSEALWKLESVLVRAGVPVECVFALAKGSPWNKYRRDGRPDLDLWKEVYKVYQNKTVIEPDDELEDLPWVSLDNLLFYEERPQWLVEDIWMEKNVGWIAGEGKSYKSILSLDLALSVASGTPFLGRFAVNNPGPVLMVQEEDPTWRVAHRIRAMAEHKGISCLDARQKDDGGIVFSFKESGVPLFISVGGRLTFEDTERMDALERAIASRRPRLLVLDPMFMMSAGIDEFKAGELAPVLNTFKHWRNEYEVAMAIVHHNRKSTGADTQKLYGSMALYAWSENSLLVQREGRDGGLVSIRRDIKDAPADDKIGVEFIDIDEEYRYVLKDLENKNPDAIANALRNKSPEQLLTLKDLGDITGLADRTLRKHVKEMEEGGLIKVDRRGRGGTLYINPTARLTDSPIEEALFD